MTDALLRSWRLTILGIVLVGPPLEHAAAHRQPTRPAVDARPVTLRGCLRSWDGTPTGIGRGQTTGDAPMQFVLTDVEPSPATAQPEQSATGTPPATGAPIVAHNTYVVEAATGAVPLGDHLDREVEVTGTLTVVPRHDASARNPRREDDFGRPGPPPPAEAPVGTAGSRESTETSPLTVQRVAVSAVKVIANTCGK